jgi:hypothetical protein
VKLTPISQRPKHPWHWDVTKVRFRDLTGDGLPEIMWDLFTVGGTGSSPSLKECTDGTAAKRLGSSGSQAAASRRPGMRTSLP